MDNFDKMYMLIGNNYPIGFYPEEFELDKFPHLSEMAVKIYSNKFMDDLNWFNERVTLDIPITSHYLINEKIGKWYDHVQDKNLWQYREYWTCKMWVVWIVVSQLLNLVVDKIGNGRGITKPKPKVDTKCKVPVIPPNESSI